MEGIILEEHSKYSIVLTSEGDFVKIRTSSTPGIVGSKINFNENHLFLKKSMVNLPTFNASIASMVAVLLLFVSIFSTNKSNEVYAYVSVDSVISMEFEVSDDMKVLNIKPLNDRANVIYKELKGWKNTPLKNVLNQLLVKAKRDGYLLSDGDVVLATTVHEEKGEELHKASEKVEKIVNRFEQREGLNVTTFKVDSSLRKQSSEYDKDLSMGRFSMVIQSNLEGKELSIEDVKKKSVSEMKRYINLDKEHITNKKVNEWIIIKNKDKEQSKSEVNGKPVKSQSIIPNVKGDNSRAPSRPRMEGNSNKKPIIKHEGEERNNKAEKKNNEIGIQNKVKNRSEVINNVTGKLKDTNRDIQKKVHEHHKSITKHKKEANAD